MKSPRVTADMLAEADKALTEARERVTALTVQAANMRVALHTQQMLDQRAALEDKIESAIIDASLQPAFAAAMNSIKQAGIEMGVRAPAFDGNAELVRFRFSLPQKASVCVAVVFVSHDESDETPLPAIYAYEGLELDVPETAVPLAHLSTYHDAEWRALAALVGMPAPYDESARITEFVVALLMEVGASSSLAVFRQNARMFQAVPDARWYYHGHNGDMLAYYPPSSGNGTIAAFD